MFSEGFFDRWRRQVGNTYIIRHVGEKPFSNYIEINMLDDSLGARLFAETKSVEGFYLQVSMLHGDELKQKENTLIFMDEIQAYPHPFDAAEVPVPGQPVYLYCQRWGR